MKTLDRRIVRTRQALTDALVSLALEQGYDELTIRAVTEAASIGYRTFFRHYYSLDDLLGQTVLTLFYGFARRASQAQTTRDKWAILYSVVRDHPDVIRIYFGLPREHPVRQRVLAAEAKILRARFTTQRTSDVPLEVSIDLYIQAGDTLLTWYLDHIDDYTPQQVAAMHEDLVSKALLRLALVQRSDWPPKRSAT